MIDKVVRRNLFKNKGLFIAINSMFLLTMILIVICIYAFFYGLNNYKEYAKNTNLEDFRVYTYEKLTDYEIHEIEEEYGLTLQKTSSYTYSYNNKQITIHPPYKENSITKPIITKGRGIRDINEVVISQEYANANNKQIGDTFNLSQEKFEIVGLASFPTLMYPIKDGSLFPDNQNVGEIYISSDMFSKINNSQSFYVGKFEDNISKKQRLAIYEDISAKYSVEIYNTNILGNLKEGTHKTSNFIDFMDREDQFALNIIHLEYLFIGVIIGGLAFLIGIIAILLSSFLFKSMVNKSRRDIGILRAEGFYVNEIISSYNKYFSYGLLVSITLGIVIGVFLSIALEYLYSSFFNIIHYTIDALIFIVLIVTFLIIFFILNFFIKIIITKNIKSKILNLIGNVEEENNIKVSKSKKQVNISFSSKMKLITLTRNRAKTILLIYGVFFSTFLMMFALSIGTSVLNIEDNLKGSYFTYDYVVNYSPDFSPSSTMYNKDSLVTFYAQLDNEKNNKDLVNVIAYNEDNQYFHMPYPEDNNIVITTKLSKDYGINAGDRVDVINPGDKNESYSFKVSDIIDVSYESTIYANEGYIKKELDLEENYYNGLVGQGKDKDYLLQGDTGAVYYSYRDLIDGIGEYSSLSNVAILYIVAVASLISLITIIVISTLIVNSNKKQVSIMKIFGYSSKEIDSLIFGYYKWLVIITYIIAYPISIYFVKYYLDFILSLVPDMTYPFVIKFNIYEFILGLIYIFLLYFISSKLTIRKINKINLSESIKKDS